MPEPTSLFTPVLNKGKLMQLDTPLHLYNKPSNRFVAGFIGSPAMNFIEGNMRQDTDFYFMDDSQQIEFSLSASHFKELEKFINKKIIIGIRPEDIVLNEKDNSHPDCYLKVMAFENMGNEQLVYLALAKNTLIARRPPVETTEIGSEVGVTFSRDKMIFMDAESGDVIG